MTPACPAQVQHYHSHQTPATRWSPVVAEVGLTLPTHLGSLEPEDSHATCPCIPESLPEVLGPMGAPYFGSVPFRSQYHWEAPDGLCLLDQEGLCGKGTSMRPPSQEAPQPGLDGDVLPPSLPPSQHQIHTLPGEFLLPCQDPQGAQGAATLSQTPGLETRSTRTGGH